MVFVFIIKGYDKIIVTVQDVFKTDKNQQVK